MTELQESLRAEKQGYEFKHLERSHLPEAAALLNQILSADISSAYLEWKYFANPAGKAISIVILFDRKVVGLLAALPIRFSVGLREVLAVEEVDLAIVEAHRRLDIYLQMVGAYTRRLIEENIAFTYGITSVNALKLNQTIIGKKEISRIPRLIKVLDAEPFLRKKFSSDLPAKICAPFANMVLNPVFGRRCGIPEGLRISRITDFDDRFNAFWQKTMADYQVTAVRDAAYLNWRYGPRMNAHYEIVCLEKGEGRELTGYIVLSEKKDEEMPRGQIMEIVAPKTDGRTVKILLGHALNYFRKCSVAAVECWMLPHCDAFSELTGLGFTMRQKEGMGLHFQKVNAKSQDAGFENIEESRNWFISLGDSDLG